MPTVLDDEHRRPERSAPPSAFDDAPIDRIVEFDYMRIVAAVVVVFLHASAAAAANLPRDDVWNLLYLSRAWARFSVPAFVFITGALVWSRVPAPGIRAYGRFLGRRLRAVLPAYLAWSAIYWLIRYGGYAPPEAAAPSHGLAGFVSALLNGTAWIHLYFVPLVVLVYVVTPVAARVIRISPALALVITVSATSIWMRSPQLAVGVPETLNRLLAYSPFAVCGAWYAIRRARTDVTGPWRIRAWPAWLAAGIALQTLYLTHVIGPWRAAVLYPVRVAWTVAITVGVAGACASLARRATSTRRAAHTLSPLTYQVYLAHPAMLAVAYWLLVATGAASLWGAPAYVPVKWAFALATSFVLAAALARVAVRKR